MSHEFLKQLFIFCGDVRNKDLATIMTSRVEEEKLTKINPFDINIPVYYQNVVTLIIGQRLRGNNHFFLQ